MDTFEIFQSKLVSTGSILASGFAIGKTIMDVGKGILDVFVNETQLVGDKVQQTFTGMGWSYKSMLQTFTTGDWSHLLWMRFLSCRTPRTYRRPNLRMRLQNCNLFRPVIFMLPATIFRILDAGVASTGFVGKQNNSQTKSHREAPTPPYWAARLRLTTNTPAKTIRAASIFCQEMVSIPRHIPNTVAIMGCT